MLTKEQEKAALKKIEKILAELAAQSSKENSYILTAFDGVLEQAAENIECDFMNSYKARAEYLNEKVIEQQAQIAAIRANAVSPEQAAATEHHLRRSLAAAREEQRQAEKTILATCDNPSGADFLNAVRAKQQAEKNADQIAELLEVYENILR